MKKKKKKKKEKKQKNNNNNNNKTHTHKKKNIWFTKYFVDYILFWLPLAKRRLEF